MISLFPDAGPLITLAYAGALDVLLKPGWAVRIVDMVLHEVTRNTTPSGKTIRAWVAAQRPEMVATSTFKHFQAAQAGAAKPVWKPNLGELAIQEAMHTLALKESTRTGVFLFEDHKIARASFLVPDDCRKISTRAYLQFLEGKGWIDSAAEIERTAIAAGR
jgi:hypothetical protein